MAYLGRGYGDTLGSSTVIAYSELVGWLKLSRIFKATLDCRALSGFGLRCSRSNVEIDTLMHV